MECPLLNIIPSDFDTHMILLQKRTLNTQGVITRSLVFVESKFLRLQSPLEDVPSAPPPHQASESTAPSERFYLS